MFANSCFSCSDLNVIAGEDGVPTITEWLIEVLSSASSKRVGASPYFFGNGNACELINPHKPSFLFLGNRQIVQILIRHYSDLHCLLTECSLKNGITIENTIHTPKVNSPRPFDVIGSRMNIFLQFQRRFYDYTMSFTMLL